MSNNKALVASKNGEGAVLWTHGLPGFEDFVQLQGPRLDSINLDHAPDGIHVWEGEMECTQGREGDWDCELSEGTFRPPTEDEWQAIRKNECPWPEEA